MRAGLSDRAYGYGLYNSILADGERDDGEGAVWPAANDEASKGEFSASEIHG